MPESVLHLTKCKLAKRGGSRERIIIVASQLGNNNNNNNGILCSSPPSDCPRHPRVITRSRKKRQLETSWVFCKQPRAFHNIKLDISLHAIPISLGYLAATAVFGWSSKTISTLSRKKGTISLWSSQFTEWWTVVRYCTGTMAHCDGKHRFRLK